MYTAGVNCKFKMRPIRVHLRTRRPRAGVSPNPQPERLLLGHADADEVILADAPQLTDALHAQDVPEAEVVVLQLGLLQELVEGVYARGPVVSGAGPAARRRAVPRQGGGGGGHHPNLKGCGPPFVVGGAERRVNRILHLTSEGGACSTPWSMEHGERIE